jgi:protein TonB
MKRVGALFVPLLVSCLCYGGDKLSVDTAIKKIKKADFSTTAAPRYPGGANAFNRYIARNLHYPDAAKLMCINGKVYVSFSIDTNGKVTDVTAINCLGAGCEAEGVKVVQRSKTWRPAIKDGKPVKMQYIIPINFTMETKRIYMENLIASGYGFIFSIKGKLYSIDDA